MWQPLSVISSLAYCLAGSIVYNRRPAVGAALIGLGLSSAAFHWTSTRAWQSADIIFIFLTFNILISLFLHRGFQLPRSILIPSIIVITSIMAFFEPVVNSMIVIIGQFLVLYFITRYFRFRKRYVWVFFIGAIFNIPHVTPLHIPDFWHDLTHSVWHGVTAYGFLEILQIEILLDSILARRKRSRMQSSERVPVSVYPRTSGLAGLAYIKHKFKKLFQNLFPYRPKKKYRRYGKNHEKVV